MDSRLGGPGQQPRRTGGPDQGRARCARRAAGVTAGEPGRDRSTGLRWGPRRIDLDLLVYGNETLATDRLTVPHPGIAHRNFVLLPLLELAPDLWIPGLGRVRQLSALLDRTTRPDGQSPIHRD
ncbi:MAG: 2-amino-4-hydroxy-6-hydroxymethyldihydropteridine diphosphokinase [Gammaproteobacteria bacterium PRO9]|nr:2-amino-4-hydroxy-6-hydroxymethyldihydropteridine diphosphokinase [Gammaproteobacteria bacterium PRO9]